MNVLDYFVLFLSAWLDNTSGTMLLIVLGDQACSSYLFIFLFTKHQVSVAHHLDLASPICKY